MTLQRWIDRGLRWWTAGVYLFLFVPIVVVIAFSFNDGRNVTQITGFSLRWYEEAWTDQFVVRALRTSLTIALVSGVIATIIGTLSAIAMNGARPAVRVTFEVLIYIAIIVPGIVIGISTLIFAVTAFDIVNPVLASLLPGDPPQLSLGLGTVIAAHAMFTSAIVNVLVRTRMAGMDRTLIEASSDLYASPWRTFRQVTIPQLRPAIVAGFLLAFTFSFDDFIVAFFTSGQDQTLPMFVFASIRRGVTPAVNAIAAVLLTVTITSLVAAWLIAGRRRRSTTEAPAAPEVSLGSAR
jgi:spermidine/putrescine transport system permease protein